MTIYPRRLHFMPECWWSHHRGDGGAWRALVFALREQLSHPRGVVFCDAVGYGGQQPHRFQRSWTGIWHRPILRGRHGGLESWLHAGPDRKAELRTCAGFITLSPSTAEYLAAETDLPAVGILYPAAPAPFTFSASRLLETTRPRMLLIGHSFRLIRPFYELPARRFAKVLVAGVPSFYADSEWAVNDSVEWVGRLTDDEYDDALASSVVFLDYTDTAANTLVVECIVRNTPILLRRSPAAEDYLTRDYPLFFSNADEAAEKADDLDLILAASRFLKDLPTKPSLTIDAFLEALVNSPVYRGLPDPDEG